MTKRLYCVRHAKSDWGDPLQQDHDRPLNKRGLAAAPAMGKRLSEFGAHPEKIISSTALRARMTAELIGKEVGYAPDEIEMERTIYTGDDETYMEFVQNTPDNFSEIMLVGHNPVMTTFVHVLTGEAIDNIVTCGVACIDFAVQSWQDIIPGAGELVFYDFPKSD